MIAGEAASPAAGVAATSEGIVVGAGAGDDFESKGAATDAPSVAGTTASDVAATGSLSADEAIAPVGFTGDGDAIGADADSGGVSELDTGVARGSTDGIGGASPEGGSVGVAASGGAAGGTSGIEGEVGADGGDASCEAVAAGGSDELVVPEVCSIVGGEGGTVEVGGGAMAGVVPEFATGAGGVFAPRRSKLGMDPAAGDSAANQPKSGVDFWGVAGPLVVELLAAGRGVDADAGRGDGAATPAERPARGATLAAGAGDGTEAVAEGEPTGVFVGAGDDLDEVFVVVKLKSATEIDEPGAVDGVNGLTEVSARAPTLCVGVVSFTGHEAPGEEIGAVPWVAGAPLPPAVLELGAVPPAEGGTVKGSEGVGAEGEDEVVLGTEADEGVAAGGAGAGIIRWIPQWGHATTMPGVSINSRPAQPEHETSKAIIRSRRLLLSQKLQPIYCDPLFPLMQLAL